MDSKIGKNNLFLIGMLGSLCYGISDWIMMYGDPTGLSKKAPILTKGTAQISTWRYILAMILSYPGTVFYIIGLYGYERYILNKKHRKIYHWLNVVNFTPWMTLHFIYIIIMFAFHFMMTNGYQDIAIPVSEALYTNFSWVIVVSILFMVPAFVYYLYLIITNRTSFKKIMGIAHMLPIMCVMYIFTALLPSSAFKKGFLNAVANQSLFISFLINYLYISITSISDKNSEPPNDL